MHMINYSYGFSQMFWNPRLKQWQPYATTDCRIADKAEAEALRATLGKSTHVQPVISTL